MKFLHNLNKKELSEIINDKKLVNQKNQKEKVRAFVCSPYGGKRKNKKLAKKIGRHCLLNMDKIYIPFIPHLLYPQFLNEYNETERYVGLYCAYQFLAVCDIVLVFITEQGITDGMRDEIKLANQLKIPVKYIDYRYI